MRHPKLSELDIFEDGRIYDTSESRFVNVNYNHSGAKGVMAYWSTSGKRYVLDVSKLVYEAFIEKDVISTSYTIKVKAGMPFHLSNLYKVRKFERDGYNIREDKHDSWYSDDIYC